jgi:hypothetical protein
MNKVQHIYNDPPIAADRQFGGIQTDLSPYVYPPEDAHWFYPGGIAALPIANGLANRIELTKPAGIAGASLPYLVPPGYEGVIKKIALQMQGNGSLDFSGDWVFQVFLDMVPVQNYEAVTFQVGTIAQPVDTFIKVKPGQTVHIYAYSQNIPGAGNATALISGYQWSLVRQQSPLTKGLQ